MECYVVCVCHLLDLDETPLHKFPKIKFYVCPRSSGFLRFFILFLIIFQCSNAAPTPTRERYEYMCICMDIGSVQNHHVKDDDWRESITACSNVYEHFTFLIFNGCEINGREKRKETDAGAPPACQLKPSCRWWVGLITAWPGSTISISCPVRAKHHQSLHWAALQPLCHGRVQADGKHSRINHNIQGPPVQAALSFWDFDGESGRRCLLICPHVDVVW